MKNTYPDKIDGQKGTLVKGTPPQVAYVAYMGLFALLCGDSLVRYGIVMKETGLLFMFAGAVIFTVVIFIYNRKYKKAPLTRQLCCVFCLWGFYHFLDRFVPLWL